MIGMPEEKINTNGILEVRDGSGAKCGLLHPPAMASASEERPDEGDPGWSSRIA